MCKEAVNNTKKVAGRVWTFRKAAVKRGMFPLEGKKVKVFMHFN